MIRRYTDTAPKSSRKVIPSVAIRARRKLQRAYGLSDAHAKLIAELQGYGRPA